MLVPLLLAVSLELLPGRLTPGLGTPRLQLFATEAAPVGAPPSWPGEVPPAAPGAGSATSSSPESELNRPPATGTRVREIGLGALASVGGTLVGEGLTLGGFVLLIAGVSVPSLPLLALGLVGCIVGPVVWLALPPLATAWAVDRIAVSDGHGSHFGQALLGALVGDVVGLVPAGISYVVLSLIFQAGVQSIGSLDTGPALLGVFGIAAVSSLLHGVTMAIGASVGQHWDAGNVKTSVTPATPGTVTQPPPPPVTRLGGEPAPGTVLIPLFALPLG